MSNLTPEKNFHEARLIDRGRDEFFLFMKNAFGSLVTIEFIRVIVPLIVLLEVLPWSGVVSRSLLPPPSEVSRAFVDMLLNRGLIWHVGDSLQRFFLGFFVALFFAVPIGTLMGWNIYIRKHCLPLLQLLAPIPPPAWVPLTIIIFGVGMPMQTFLIFLGVFYPVLFNTYQGVKDTDPRYVASARIFGASEWTLIRYVYLPHAAGSIIMGIKIGVAMGLVMLVIAEMYGARSGIGFLLVEAKDFFLIDRMVVCMLILGGFGWFLIEIMKFIELKLAVWKVGR